MSRVLERRRYFLHLMREFTLDKGFFTTADIQQTAKVPRSTAQDWINRLLEERCVVVKEEQHGRAPAHYASSSAMPSSACRRIFTTTDGECVEIYHDCMSSACAAFCGFHHNLAGGVLDAVTRDGTLLRECAKAGTKEVEVGLFPAPAVAVVGIEREGGYVVQRIRCIGGPAYSLTDMMALAKGVYEVRVERTGPIVEGRVYTKALIHLAIGIDDTDSSEGGATFALALALLQHLGRMEGIFPITHRVVMLNPEVREKTAGNSCSFIEIAVEPKVLTDLPEKIYKFVVDEAHSPEWGVAVKRGFTIPEGLRVYGNRVRTGIVTRQDAVETGARFGIALHGGRGVIGALAAVALAGLPTEVLLDIRAAAGK
jgi:hypothetical protein